MQPAGARDFLASEARAHTRLGVHRQRERVDAAGVVQHVDAQVVAHHRCERLGIRISQSRLPGLQFSSRAAPPAMACRTHHGQAPDMAALHGQIDRDQPAERKADDVDVGLRPDQHIERGLQGRHQGGHGVVRARLVGVAIAWHVSHPHRVRSGQRLDVLHPVPPAAMAAVQQDHRRAAAKAAPAQAAFAEIDDLATGDRVEMVDVRMSGGVRGIHAAILAASAAGQLSKTAGFPQDGGDQPGRPQPERLQVEPCRTRCRHQKQAPVDAQRADASAAPLRARKSSA